MEFIENVKSEFNNKRIDNSDIQACGCTSEPYDVGDNRDNSNSQTRILCKSESYDVVRRPAAPPMFIIPQKPI